MKALKFFFLACLLVIGGQAFSQNGTNPYLNSTHNYKVTGAGGTLVWSVLNSEGNEVVVSPNENAVVTLGTNGGENIDITWLSEGTYTVQVTETAAAASGGCSTIRQIPVTVIGNTFDIAIANLDASCSDASGNIIKADNDLGTTSKTFTINMNGAAFNPDWKFDYEVTSTSGDLVSVNFDTNTAVDSPVLGKNTATGTVTVNNADSTIELTVVFNNTWDSGDVVTVSLSNGVELTHKTPELDADLTSNNNTGSVIINAMPATTKITTD